jgi:RNA polymerase sigma-70 factor (ECF subfamily)
MNDPKRATPAEEVLGYAGSDAAFSTTLWTVVLDAKNPDSPAASDALESLCRTYWYPLYVFIRRRGHGAFEAEDLTQAFFAHILEKGALKTVGRGKGKFRSFLLAALTNFLNNHYQKSRARKRGGRTFLESWEALDAEERYRHEPVDDITPERLFERRWGFILVEQVLRQLREDYQAAGKLNVFEEIHPLLVGEVSGGAIGERAKRLGMTEGALKVALHRLRRRFGEILRNQIAATVASPNQVEEEIRYLFSIISS